MVGLNQIYTKVYMVTNLTLMYSDKFKFLKKAFTPRVCCCNGI